LIIILIEIVKNDINKKRNKEVSIFDIPRAVARSMTKKKKRKNNNNKTKLHGCIQEKSTRNAWRKEKKKTPEMIRTKI
jgi:hypothetical protein